MKFIKNFNLFEEVRFRDIRQISTEFDEFFTVAFEFEIETLDRENIKLNLEDFDDAMLDDIFAMITNDLEIKSRKEKKIIKDKLYELLDNVEFGNIDIHVLDSIFDTDNIEDDGIKEIISYLKSLVMSFISEEDMDYLIMQCKRHLPNFTKKWSRRIDYVGDATLERGIEIKPKKYVKSISESIEYLTDFFEDMKNQNYWHFSERTGLHINIGTIKKVEYNPIKGLLLMNDFSKEENIPLVFKDMTWRMNNQFCGSLIPAIWNLPAEEKIKLKENIDLKDIKSAEKILNGFLYLKVKEWGHKNFGFNITRIQDNYVEFRYAGGEISKEVLIEKVKYFSFLVYCMTNSEYKKKEYLKKLFTFVESLSE